MSTGIRVEWVESGAGIPPCRVGRDTSRPRRPKSSLQGKAATAAPQPFADRSTVGSSDAQPVDPCAVGRRVATAGGGAEDDRDVAERAAAEDSVSSLWWAGRVAVGRPLVRVLIVPVPAP